MEQGSRTTVARRNRASRWTVSEGTKKKRENAAETVKQFMTRRRLGEDHAKLSASWDHAKANEAREREFVFCCWAPKSSPLLSLTPSGRLEAVHLGLPPVDEPQRDELTYEELPVIRLHAIE